MLDTLACTVSVVIMTLKKQSHHAKCESFSAPVMNDVVVICSMRTVTCTHFEKENSIETKIGSNSNEMIYKKGKILNSTNGNEVKATFLFGVTMFNSVCFFPSCLHRFIGKLISKRMKLRHRDFAFHSFTLMKLMLN